jgi:hypothetical protein
MASKRAHGDSGINILMPGDTSCLLLHRGNFKIAAGIRDGRPATEDCLPSLVSGLNFPSRLIAPLSSFVAGVGLAFLSQPLDHKGLLRLACTVLHLRLTAGHLATLRNNQTKGVARGRERWALK